MRRVFIFSNTENDPIAGVTRCTSDRFRGKYSVPGFINGENRLVEIIVYVGVGQLGVLCLERSMALLAQRRIGVGL